MSRYALKFAMLSVVSSALVVGSVIALAYLWQVWGDRGLYTNAIVTSGYSTTGEKLLLVASALGLPAFAALTAVFLVMFSRHRRLQ